MLRIDPLYFGTLLNDDVIICRSYEKVELPIGSVIKCRVTN